MSETGTDDAVLSRILAIAHADPRIRAVILSGSRADPAASPDRWQDYDVTFVVHDIASFRDDPEWIDIFGERAILQRPDNMVGAPTRTDGAEVYLMLFVDGSRIDLSLVPVESMDTFEHDGLALSLVDLDGIVPPPPQDVGFWVPRPPTAVEFADVCNEFWWVAPYVAKGFARGETAYARHHLDTVLRAQLFTVLGWQVASASNFQRGPGKFGRHLRRELSAEAWSQLEATYADADPEHGWAALDAMAELFRRVAVSVADRFGFVYPWQEDERVVAHLERVRDESIPRGRSPSQQGISAGTPSVRPARRERHPMPDDVREALEAAGVMDAYQTRPPYQRNDYLGWIARAKRLDTRARRLRQMLDELAEGGTYMKMAWAPGKREG